jgi:hypothetical protein
MPDASESIKSIKSLKQDPKNARKRTAQSKHLIEESLKRYGAARSIVIDETDRILAGNGTIDAATRSGINKVRIIETDGDEIIAVRRKGLSEEEKVGLALADNRTSDLSEWDAQMLAQLSTEHDILPWFSEDDISELLGKEDTDFDPDDPEDQSGKIDDVFQIIVNCTSEEEQTTLLNRLLEENYECRALNS